MEAAEWLILVLVVIIIVFIIIKNAKIKVTLSHQEHCRVLFRIYAKRVLNAAVSDCQQFVKRSNGF